MSEPDSNNQPPQDQYQPPPANGYQAPPSNGYQAPPQGGYPPPPPQYSGQPMRPDEERTWSLLAHVGTIILGFIAPLIVLLVKGNESPTVRAHAVESLNFQITASIGYIASYILMVVLIGFITLPAIWILAVVFAIMATMAASSGKPYKYPFALRLVK
ncbi:DUF4870 domain-containing protein [Streptomyces sp. SID13031]|uniref:DUF4870 domain-containing protein n=1 Tax=Streptomyces sp. SID13031 TaxID=2706046 RepID=UPI0013CCED05|nr:DUF4870 domain-containing protein [Streptomyces sp. SID13031]NEA35840.1 DUF4870 domain-containing protein [Streptomyces sp. SID13031]